MAGLNPAVCRAQAEVLENQAQKIKTIRANVDSLVEERRFAVKHITVDCGGMLSLQRHIHRAEHWVVVRGTATVTINGETRLVTENESVYVPLGAIHRIANEGKMLDGLARGAFPTAGRLIQNDV